jgi:hypothetical protein
VSSASSADTVAAFAVERESLIRVSLALDFVGLPFFALCLLSLVISIYYSIRDIVLSLTALELELSSARTKVMRS